jgi:hypothetical protein
MKIRTNYDRALQTTLLPELPQRNIESTRSEANSNKKLLNEIPQDVVIHDGASRTNRQRNPTHNGASETGRSLNRKAVKRLEAEQLSPILLIEQSRFISEVLADDVTPLEDRIQVLKEQRRALIRANLPTKHITIAIRKLSQIYEPQQLILSQAPYQLFITLNATTHYSDEIVTRSTNLLLLRVNDVLYGKRWQKKNLGISGFIVLEKQSKPLRIPDTDLRYAESTRPHLHMLLKPEREGELLDKTVVAEAFEYVCESPGLQVEKLERNEHGVLVWDDEHRIRTEPVFDAEDVEIKQSLSNFDDQNLARYLTKNLGRGQNTSDQYGVGLYHFNRDGLAKVR